MYPHERSLVKKLEDKPFVLLGINSDPKDHLQAAIKKENITWRSWWDGGDTHGPIATAWNVSAWPTMFLVDAKGVVRHAFIGNGATGELDKAIDELVAEIPPK
jgi:peroxiredoxin